MCLGNMSLKRKSVFTFPDDLETTFTLQFLDKIEKFPFTAFLFSVTFFLNTLKLYELLSLSMLDFDDYV